MASKMSLLITRKRQIDNGENITVVIPQSPPSKPNKVKIWYDVGWYYCKQEDCFVYIPVSAKRNQVGHLIYKNVLQRKTAVTNLSELTKLSDQEMTAVDALITEATCRLVGRICFQRAKQLDVDATVLTGEVLLRVNRSLRENKISFFEDSLSQEEHV